MMNKPTEIIFTTRPTVILELPLTKNTRILHPEQVILKIGENYFDVGAFCFAIRSNRQRKRGKAREVALVSFLKQRPKQILLLINALSRHMSEAGKRAFTIQSYVSGGLKPFLDWADSCGLNDCLSGGNATRQAFRAWVKDTRENYRRQEFGEVAHNNRITHVCELLEATTDIEDLHSNIRLVKRKKHPQGNTEPLAPHDFTHAVAINQALFEGLCDLVLEPRPFPYKLVLPATLGWAENHLWLFPTSLWRLPPHLWGAERESRTYANWAYDYAVGGLASPEDIAHRYAQETPNKQFRVAQTLISKAQAQIDDANADERNWYRVMLGITAHNAFLFLFFCNTGANESVAREIETNGEINAETLNQQYRSVKFRAFSKPITVTVPSSFMMSLRRFMDLRRYLLNDKPFPKLFFSLSSGGFKDEVQF